MNELILPELELTPLSSGGDWDDEEWDEQDEEDEEEEDLGDDWGDEEWEEDDLDEEDEDDEWDEGWDDDLIRRPTTTGPRTDCRRGRRARPRR